MERVVISISIILVLTCMAGSLDGQTISSAKLAAMLWVLRVMGVDIVA